MKRIYSLILALLTLILLFTGCGYKLVRETEPPVDTDNTEETEPLPNISVSFTKNQQEYKNDDGQVLLSFSGESAAITITDNTAVAGAINTSLTAAYDTFCSYTEEYVSSAKEQFSQTPTEYWTDYIMAREIATGRLDKRIASIIYNDYYYLGGAHGSTVITAQNYDMSTGRLLTLADLAVDKQLFSDFTLKYLLWLVEKPGFSDMYPWATEDALKMIITDNFWYFTHTGLEFVCNEYSIGPYAAGITRLEIPYKDLEGVVSEEWLPLSD